MFKKKFVRAIRSKEVLILDLQRVARKFGLESVPIALYRKKGKFSVKQYYTRFGSWNLAMEKAGLLIWNDFIKSKANGRRKAGDKLRMEVFKRDNFRCVLCGASPANEVGVTLHADHIVPFSKGGATVLENLQTLCGACNLGKGAQ
jgi:5-methylcytosine-specific restriction endonuclease McrA